MNREELLQNAKPILFNTEMVQAILDGRKTVTRRVVKPKYNNTHYEMRTDKCGTGLIEIQNDVEGVTYGKNEDGSTWHRLLGCVESRPPYKKGDILYVRETWAEWTGGYLYKAGTPPFAQPGELPMMKWSPSIHMSKEAARIFLQVTDVRAERLNDMTIGDCEREGVMCGNCGDIFAFMQLWNSTIKKPDRARYGWAANPWVWVIEFEVAATRPQQCRLKEADYAWDFI